MKPDGARRERSGFPAPGETTPHPAATSLWERFCSRENLAAALRRVELNAGVAGIDGISTKELRPRLLEHWPQVRSQLEAGIWRGHRFVRYADDIMVYVASERAGQRVMGSITQYVEARLKLRVNHPKSAVAPATKRPFLGFGFFYRGGEVKVRVDLDARERAKDRLRRLTARNWGVSMERRIRELNRYTVGWTAYFAYADTPSPFSDLDEWLRRRLRQVRWKEWKRCRTRRRNLRALGIPERAAREWGGSRKGYWRIAGSAVLNRALPNAYWADLGLHGFSRSLSPFPGRNANRRVRTRMPGGVVGAGVTPAPTRSGAA